MAITLVGTVTHITAASATPDEVSLPMGMAEGDIVLAACATDSAAVFPNPSDGLNDYTTIFNTNNIVAYGAFYKVQGATPDSTIFLPGWRETGDFPTPWVVAVFRGVDVTTPLDQTSVADTGSGQPNPGAITTVTDGAAVVSFGMLDDDNITSCTQSGATDVAFIGGGVSSNTSSIMFGWQTQVTAGAVDPAAFSTDGTDAWAAVTIALKPAAEGGGDTLVVDVGQIAADGQSVNLLSAAILGATASQVAVEGQAVSITSPLSVVAAQIVADGGSVGVLLASLLPVATSGVAVSGQSVGILSAAILPVNAGQVAVAGQAVGVIGGGVISVVASEIAVVGQGVELLSGSVLPVSGVSVVSEGQSVGLFSGAVLPVVAASAVIEGQAVDLVGLAGIPVIAAQVAVAGQSVSLLVALRLLVSSSEIVVSSSSVVVSMSVAVAESRRPNIFGVNMASILGRALGPLTFDIVLTRENQGSRDPANLAGGRVDYDGGSSQSWSCKGWVDQWTLYELQNSIIQAGDRKVVILGGTLQADIEPETSDIVTIENEDLRIVSSGIKRDPAGATYTCQCRK